MFQSSGGWGNPPASFTLPSFNQEAVRHILLGDYGAIIDAMNRMALLGYCVGGASPEGLRLAWSEPLPTGRKLQRRIIGALRDVNFDLFGKQFGLFAVRTSIRQLQIQQSSLGRSLYPPPEAQ